MKAKPIEQAEFKVDELIRNHPPQWRHRNKSVVFEIARSSGFPFEGRIKFARWEEERPTGPILAQGKFSIRPGLFDYAMPKERNVIYWHLNFADPNLFLAYGSPLLAQDELQVAEHPVLGSLRDALASEGRAPMTISGRGHPTPVTISGVQRRCAIDTRPIPGAGRQGGLYGNAFARAPRQHVIAATKALMPPTISNILAMAAPACGYGNYTEQEIVYVLNTAFTGFSAAHRESRRIAGASSQTVIHTGFGDAARSGATDR